MQHTNTLYDISVLLFFLSLSLRSLFALAPHSMECNSVCVCVFLFDILLSVFDTTLQYKTSFGRETISKRLAELG